MKVFNYFDTVIVFAIPLTTIIILNTFTALAVWKVASVRRTMTDSKRRANKFFQNCFVKFQPFLTGNRASEIHKFLICERIILNPQNLTCMSATKVRRKKVSLWYDFNFVSKASEKSANTSQIKVTKMLLLVSSVFVCLNLPSYIMRIKVFLIEVKLLYSQMNIFLTNFCL